MKIERTEKDLLVDQISITLEPKDYLPLVDKQIKKLKRTVALPGFRVGFAPEILIRKHFEKSVLVDTVERLINDNLLKYLNENQITTLGRPLVSENVPSSFNPDKTENYIFHFDIAKAPEIDAKLSSEIKLVYKNITLTDEMFEKQLNGFLTRKGRSLSVKQAGPDVLIYAEIQEIEDGKNIEKSKLLKKYLFFNKLPENVKKIFSELNLGSSIELLAGDIFPDDSERNYVLDLKDDKKNNSKNLLLRITPIKYFIWKKAELNQEFFDRIYGKDVVKSEEEFRERFKNDLKKSLSKESDYLFTKEVRNKLIEYFEPPLPDDFLKRFLKTISNIPITDTELEKEYPSFARTIRWDLIVNAISKRYSLSVGEEELENHIKNAVIEYFISQEIPIIDAYVNYNVKNILEDQDKLKDYKQEILEMKIADLCKKHCSVIQEEMKEEEV